MTVAIIASAFGTNVNALVKRSKEILNNNHSSNSHNQNNNQRPDNPQSKRPQPKKSSKPQIHVNPYIFSIAEQLSKSNNKVIGTVENVIKHLGNPNYQRAISDLINLNRHDFGIIAPLIMRIYNSERHN